MAQPALLLDTNVWHEFETGADSEHGSSELVLWALANDVRLGIAAHSLKDLFALIERDMKTENRREPLIDDEHNGPAARAMAWGALTSLIDQVEIVGSDYMDAYLALKYRNLHDYYEDNLVIAACERMKADALVTNDRKLAKHAPVLCMTPKDALLWLQVKLG
ncbi:MAG: type II toxin-antitoxin system VapC family toxin [Eggerthellaceae bacterium]|nr:type II toxin-antitoxin system VapC family toxin [Eggerthellaceae bacterium]